MLKRRVCNKMKLCKSCKKLLKDWSLLVYCNNKLFNLFVISTYCFYSHLFFIFPVYAKELSYYWKYVLGVFLLPKCVFLAKIFFYESQNKFLPWWINVIIVLNLFLTGELEKTISLNCLWYWKHMKWFSYDKLRPI